MIMFLIFAIIVEVAAFRTTLILTTTPYPCSQSSMLIREATSSGEGDRTSDGTFNKGDMDSIGGRNDLSGAFQGAGLPRPDLKPEDIPPLLMEALAWNDFPYVDSGIKSVWAFAGDITRHIFSQNRTEFIESVHETANTFPTSFYGAAMYGKNWTMEAPINLVGGEDGWIATQVMKTYSSDGRMRRWQWELRRNRRPPNLDCWFVESIGSSDRKGDFEVE
jgi:hypothetical protein